MSTANDGPPTEVTSVLWKHTRPGRHLGSFSSKPEIMIPVEEIEKGLWPAVEEFLENNDNWELEKKYENCNGLTILKRIKTV